MRSVVGEELLRGLVVTEVIVAIGKAEPTLADIEQIGCRIFEVGCDVRPEERTDSGEVEVDDRGAKIVEVGDGIDSVEPARKTNKMPSVP